MKYKTTIESDKPTACDECGNIFASGDTYFEFPKPHSVLCEDCVMSFEHRLQGHTLKVTTAAAAE